MQSNDKSLLVQSKTLLLICLLFAAGTGCTKVSGKRYLSEKPVNTHQTVWAGAAKIDITPPPGFPMGGHSTIGQISRGQWLRLKARSLYVEAPDGSKLALVAADLWSMPAGLVDEVAKNVKENAKKECQLGRDQIILAASHTHQSPGNFSTSPLYNLLASPRAGFDPNLLDFLSDRISKSIIDSCESAEAATLHFKNARVEGLARNRSIEAFLKNDEAHIILDEGKGLPEGPLPQTYSQDKRAFHAIDPRLQELWIASAHTPSQVIAIAAFTAVHPTALNHLAKIYSSDLFGAASIIAERELKKTSKGRPPIVAIFNGPQGDVSPAWADQDRSDVLRLGKVLANAILKAKVHGQTINGKIETHFAIEQLSGQCLHAQCTSKHSEGGLAAFGGAEDGRTQDYGKGCREGVATDRVEGHSAKEATAECRFKEGFAHFLQRTVSPAPKEVPLSIVKIDSIVFVTLPGEFTTVMGRRIRNALAGKLSIESNNIVLIGLANEYVSYFTTPAEYKVQHYEGGMTLYGGIAGTIVGDRLNNLNESNQSIPEEYEYTAGIAHSFTPTNLPAIDLNELTYQIQDTVLMSDMRSYCWRGPAVNVSQVIWYNWNASPSVKVEAEQPDKRWLILKSDSIPEDDQGLDIIIELAQWRGRQSKWCAFWFPPSEHAASTVRFRVTNQDGSQLTSPPIPAK